jgi:hypothetical protein
MEKMASLLLDIRHLNTACDLTSAYIGALFDISLFIRPYHRAYAAMLHVRFVPDSTPPLCTVLRCGPVSSS